MYTYFIFQNGDATETGFKKELSMHLIIRVGMAERRGASNCAFGFVMVFKSVPQSDCSAMTCKSMFMY